jgi:outer membrane immunogenic protein
MKKQLLCGVAASALTVAVSGTTLAADMPVKAAPLPGCIWSGVYGGGHVGWGESTFKGTWFGNSVTQDFKQHPSGFLGGVQVGQNWCSNTFVYGWEADVSFMNWKKTSQFSEAGPPADTLTNKLSLLSSLRARLGIITDPRTLLYVTGGLAYARAKATMFDSDIPGTLTATFNKFGGVVGVGAEWAQTNNWTWRIEGLYYIFDAQKTLGPSPLGAGDFATDKLKDVFVIRLGLNYKFGDPWGKGPVVAKY